MWEGDSLSHRAVIVGLGEILWDMFPDGALFGGAPANFVRSAADLAQGACQVLMVSGVGDDELGRRGLESLAQHGVDVESVQRLKYPTGTVDVQIDAAGHASYRFAVDTAWDHLSWSDELARLAAQADVVCFGTLGQRGAESLATIRRFVRSTPQSSLRLLDINLRPPYWTEQVVLDSLELANAVKLNDEELVVLAGLLDLRGSELDMLRQLLDRYPFRIAALTRGARGAILMDAGGNVSELPSPAITVVDTVGAGDAFSAALVIGLSRGWPLAVINAWAVRVAAYVCSQAGASPRMSPELLASLQAEAFAG